MMTTRSLKIVILTACLVGLPIVAFWLGGLYVEAVDRSDDAVLRGRLAQMELALRLYYDEHGTFPPTKYQPEAGGPVHSWRVLVLDRTRRRDRLSSYDFSKEWNSEQNLQALGEMAPPYFRVTGEGSTTQLLGIGSDDEWPTKTPLKSRLIREGKDWFLLVEYPDSEIHWMEPKY